MEIQIKNLAKTYGEKKVLDIESLNLEREKITGIIGPNGSGKSTLLNIIAGLDDKYDGQVLYNGELIDSDIRKKMTLVFQKAYLFKRTVYKNIAYPLEVRGVKEEKIKQKVLELLKILEIEDLKMKIGSKLSGGETQKVALARGLVFNPELLLLDEPTSNIDPEYIEHMEKAILKYNKENKGTVIIVTHNINQAKRLCDNIIKLERGRVIN
ncbi:energy-coupling factor ABC transporter ATP-binding protein [Tissierella creatinophila]|uniref:Sulfate/thiosulfate import ATP-binding protein CysA n=1 Tax=Tissierella creatinophila DSM 6911 TaxID=1123403 RepID=A0A1U7M8X8_TISCR|nr:ATP-binding cassette domain-containing protein [Tissierella creatinophila]OLS03731.1 sulfate/thiosulfate import ATP-binding protein CysA [Tissierella creatinophila DSM 6911]